MSFLSRFLLAILFLMAGFGKLGDGFGRTLGYMQSVLTSMSPEVLKMLLILTIVVEIGGGLALIFNFWRRFAVDVLIIFTLLASVLFHNNFSDQNEMIMFLKNIAIVGGLLAVRGKWCKHCGACDDKSGTCGSCEVKGGK